MKTPKRTKPKSRIFLLDAHAVARRCLVRLIESEPDLSVCGEAADMAQTLRNIASARPDVAVVNVDPLNGDGFAAVNRLRWENPALPIVVISLREQAAYGQRLLQAGAAGYVAKTDAAEKIIPALRRVLGGGVYNGR